MKQEGLTLLELMVTLAIVAILTSIAIPVYRDYVSTSRNVEALNNMQSLRLAEEEYYMENHSYIAGTYDAVSGTKTLQTGLGWSPAEPDSQQQFSYAVAITTSTFTITSKGLNRQVPSSVVLTVQ